ncbi:hypothetical protein SynBIOSE41_01117 [Synechococcus sp. BIOS-E4-1]|nr:hypothetical protein SynBIOSE41_01117 [Synechococcus sp. BIOS-E4-1]
MPAQQSTTQPIARCWVWFRDASMKAFTGALVGTEAGYCPVGPGSKS